MTIMPTGTIGSQYQFGSSTVRFQDIHNIQDQKVHNEKVSFSYHYLLPHLPHLNVSSSKI